jgi:hypothetical protein
MADLRAEPRYLCSDLVTLYWQEGAQGELREAVVLENISASGACVQAERSVPESASVRLVCGKAEFHGCVRFCYWRDDGYFIGIAFDAGSKWSKAKFEPEHLLDPREVKTRPAKSRTMFAVVRVYASALGGLATTFMALSSQYSTRPSR